LDAIIIVEYDPRRVDDLQATLELNGLQSLRVSQLRCNGTHLHGDGRSKGHDKHSRLKTNAMTYLGALEGVDQAALANIREADDADSDTLRRARFACLEAEQRRRGSIIEVHAVMRACGAEGECWGCVAEVFEPCLGILAGHQIYKRPRAKPA
jgi:hypothetical protein